MKYKRIFLLILDSLGVGESKDAYKYESIGSSTLGHINEKCPLFIPNLQRIGFLNTLSMTDDDKVEAYYTIAHPTNVGVDSLSGHYEMVGASLEEPYQRFPTGFDEELLQNISNITGRRIIGNICCTNDDIINDLGDTERNYGSLIVYTSGDSNLQVAAHEDTIPIKTLYEYCERIKELTIKENIRISRIIARPFTGENKYTFLTSARKEFVNNPKKETVLNLLEKEKLNVIGIGKVNDIFKNNGITKSIINKCHLRTKLFYCHAYHPEERGTNENINKMIRKYLPKGYNFDNEKPEYIKFIQEEINNYPRKIFDYDTANDKFIEELKKLHIPKESTHFLFH